MPKSTYVALAIIVTLCVAIIIFSSKIPGSVTGLEATQEVSQKIDSSYLDTQRQAGANALVTLVTYVRDPRTGLCFACIPGTKGEMHFTSVPRESIPDSLLYTGIPMSFPK